MHRALRAVAGWWLTRRLPPNLSAGDVCAVISEDGGYQIAKVLKADRSIVHVQVYKERFPAVPAHVDTGTLSLGTIHDADGFGMGHLPLSRRSFAWWAPVRIQSESVCEEELDGYRVWEESGGGVWGLR